MPERAQVTSVEAIETFRSHLIVFLSKARPAVEEVSADVLRARSWLETDQRAHWEGELRRRRRALEQAQQALFSARISNLRDERAAEQMAFQRAKRAVDEAEEKLRVLKFWRRDFDSRVQPLAKQTEKLHTVLSNDMVQAIAYLGQVVRALDAYAEVAPPSVTSTPSGPTAAGTSGSAPASEAATGVTPLAEGNA